MSEAAKLMGTAAPGRTITHNGKAFTFCAALSHAALARLEAGIYDRLRTSLEAFRTAYPPDKYLERLDELRADFDKGVYAIGTTAAQEFLDTNTGRRMLMCEVCGGATDAELHDLLTDRADEVKRILEDIAAATFPDAPKKGTAVPKRTPRLPKWAAKGKKRRK